MDQALPPLKAAFMQLVESCALTDIIQGKIFNPLITSLTWFTLAAKNTAPYREKERSRSKWPSFGTVVRPLKMYHLLLYTRGSVWIKLVVISRLHS